MTLQVKDPLVVLHAVSALTRTPLSWFERRKVPARRLYLRAAMDLCPTAARRDIGELVGADRNAAARASRGADPRVKLVARVVSDPRFAVLHDRPLFWPSGAFRHER